MSTGNAGGLTVVIGTDDPLSMGDIGEGVRDLPLVTEKLRKSLKGFLQELRLSTSQSLNRQQNMTRRIVFYSSPLA